MISFFVQEILEKLYPGIVPDDEGELESCIVDGSGDGGADFLYRTDDGQLLLIQAKYRGKDGAESAEAVGRVCDALERLYLGVRGKQDSLHKDLLDLAGQIDWDEDTFRVYFITTGKSAEAVKDRVKQGLVRLPRPSRFGRKVRVPLSPSLSPQPGTTRGYLILRLLRQADSYIDDLRCKWNSLVPFRKPSPRAVRWRSQRSRPCPHPSNP